MAKEYTVEDLEKDLQETRKGNKREDSGKRGHARKEAAKRMRSKDEAPSVSVSIFTSSEPIEGSSDPYERTVQRGVAESEDAPKEMRKAAARGQSMKAHQRIKGLESEKKQKKEAFNQKYGPAIEKAEKLREKRDALEVIKELMPIIEDKESFEDRFGKDAIEKAEEALRKAEEIAKEGHEAAHLDVLRSVTAKPTKSEKKAKALRKHARSVSEKAYR